MTADGTFIDLDQLQGGGPIFAAALQGLNERIVGRRTHRQVLRDTHRKLLQAQHQSWPTDGELEQRATAIEPVMTAAVPEHPALPGPSPQFGPATLPTTRSCQ